MLDDAVGDEMFDAEGVTYGSRWSGAKRETTGLTTHAISDSGRSRGANSRRLVFDTRHPPGSNQCRAFFRWSRASRATMTVQVVPFHLCSG